VVVFLEGGIMGQMSRVETPLICRDGCEFIGREDEKGCSQRDIYGDSLCGWMIRRAVRVIGKEEGKEVMGISSTSCPDVQIYVCEGRDGEGYRIWKWVGQIRDDGILEVNVKEEEKEGVGGGENDRDSLPQVVSRT
jgi:hypothetical protein